VINKSIIIERIIVVVIAGVSGAGKTTIGELLSKKYGWHFYNGDDYHSEENIRKMSSGIPLTDEDRWPWLLAVRNLILYNEKNLVKSFIECSVLKKKYRDYILEGTTSTSIIYLDVQYEEALRRLNCRTGHFFKPNMLKTQFQIAETPTDHTVVDTNSKEIPSVLQEIENVLKLNNR
jgi:carbohydrate kinase (thermoresistant glucokinase family)